MCGQKISHETLRENLRFQKYPNTCGTLNTIFIASLFSFSLKLLIVASRRIQKTASCLEHPQNIPVRLITNVTRVMILWGQKIANVRRKHSGVETNQYARVRYFSDAYYSFYARNVIVFVEKHEQVIAKL